MNDSHSPGLSSALIRSFQARATTDNLPIWLEATTAQSRDLYAKLGFKVVEKMVLGKGRAAPDGSEMQDGEGVEVWGMIWWPAD
jgi:hypothetical protein